MKKLEKSVIVYRNTIHENITKQALEAAKKRLQSLLNEWSKLEIGECTDIGGLLMRPEQAYNTAIDKLIDVPAKTGRFAVKKDSVLNTLDLPDPSNLYASAKSIRQQPFCASVELWDVEGNEVILNTSEAERYIDSQSVYASQPDKIALVKDVNKLCELYNSINERLNGELIQGTPWTFNHFRGKFTIRQKTNGGLYEITPEVDYLRSVLQR